MKLSVPTTLPDLLRRRAEELPNSGYRFLHEGSVAEATTYAELDRDARAIATRLLAEGITAGTPVLLLYAPGLDFLRGFFGCLYAGAAAVPVLPPNPARLEKTLPRLRTIAADTGATVLLTTEMIASLAEPILPLAPELAPYRWIATDSIRQEGPWREPSIAPSGLALLQYTSGSTGNPRGVVLTHANLLHNQGLIHRAFRGIADVTVSWLPVYHDMGLIGKVLGPLYIGGTCVLMSPLDFLQSPYRWLAAISEFRGTTSGGPNFAFELCARKVTDAQIDALDLSSWQVACCGAEPIRHAALSRFAERFARAGFRASALLPCYGLAEASLIVTGASRPEGMRSMRVEDDDLQRGVLAPSEREGARRLVGCGPVVGDQEVVIVADGAPCPPGAVGEIWLRGGSVGTGYWNKPEATEAIFNARLADGRGPFLRTGDLGAFDLSGELFVVGRIKDVLIVRGRNHYPQDVERTVEESCPALRPGGAAAFALEGNDGEELAVVAECDPRALADEAARAAAVDALRAAVVTAHELSPRRVALVAPGQVPKTMSGKVQRSEARRRLLAGELDALYAWEAPEAPAPSHEPTAANVEATLSKRDDEVLAFLASWLAKNAGQAFDPLRAFAEYGLDSLKTAALAADLGAWLGRPLDVGIAWNFPTPAALARHLAGSARARPEAPLTVRADEPIAVVGIGCRFPGGVDGPDALWRRLLEGFDAVTEIPPERWDADAWYSPDPDAPGRMVSRAGGFVRDIDRFDAHFFGIAPREAVRVDPQQRMLLETAWEALENAGARPDALAGSRTGVYVGICASDYQRRLVDDPAAIDPWTMTGTALSVAAGRVSYALGLNGPSVAVDTACSSSLLAIHLACRAIRDGECDLAIAGGVNAVLEPEGNVYFSRVRAMSPTGRCKTFDARADGYVRAEGCGLVVLKPLAAARRDGDPVLAVIRGSAANQDGRTNGLTAPSGPAQEDVIRTALERASMPPARVGYVEAHGTGTPLGDPIELAALGAVLGEGRSHDRPVFVGSIKTNIGHTEGAAGVAGFIKTVLAVHHGTIPAHLHFERPSPYIPWERLPVRVPTSATPWPATGEPRAAGVSAFGFSGTNVHVIVEQAPPAGPGTTAESPRAELMVLSARDPAALRAQAERLAARVESRSDLEPDLDLADACFTAATGRARFALRRSVVAATTGELAAGLREIARSDLAEPSAVTPERAPRVAFMFTGQGAQYAGMGRALYASFEAYRAAFDRCAAVLDPLLGSPLRDVVHGDDPRLDDTRFTQPALFAHEWALAELWRSLGVVPHAVTGHSVGELVAAAVAGVFSLEDALGLVAARARVMGALPRGGAMASVGAPEARVRAVIEARAAGVSIAAVNAPDQTVIAGPEEGVRSVAGALEADGVFVKRLEVSHAFHSALMDPMLDEFAAACARVAFSPPRVPLYGNLSGERVGAEITDPAYWVRHVREPVRFAAGVSALVRDGVEALLEVGPAPVLVGLARREASARGVATLASLRRGADARHTLLSSLGSLWELGAPVEWAGLYGPGPRRRVELPTYPFQRQRYWAERPSRAPSRGPRTTTEALERGAFALAGEAVSVPGDAIYRVVRLSPERTPELYDHRVFGRVVVAGAAHLATVIAVASESLGLASLALEDVQFVRPLLLDDEGADLYVSLVPLGTGDGWRFSVSKRSVSAPGSPDSFHRHVDGVVRAAHAEPRLAPALLALGDTCAEPVAQETFDAMLDATALGWGARWRWLRALRRGPGAISAALAAPDSSAHTSPLPPALLDNAFGAAGLAAFEGPDSVVPMLPFSIRALRWYGAPSGDVRLAARSDSRGDSQGGASETRQSDLVLASGGRVVVEVEGLTVKRAAREAFLRAGAGASASEARDVEQGARSRRGPAPRFDRLRSLPEGARRAELVAMLRAEAARVFGLAPERVPADRPLKELGLDSLMALELRDRLVDSVGRPLPATLLFDHPTLGALAGFLLGLLAPDARDEAPSPAPRDVAADEPIAIVGMACRFPGNAVDPDAYWALLRDGIDGVTEVPASRWNVDAWYDPDPDAPGKMSTRWGAFLEGVERFEPAFFGLTPREAASMDPQQRLLLETSWEALEHGGINPAGLQGTDTGVFVGLCFHDYESKTVDPARLDAFTLTGSAASVAAGRVAYTLGLQGPTLTVDTACSSSLVSVHLASEALRRGECELALAGGVNLMFDPRITVGFSRLHAMSPTGRCHSFSADADGYVRGEGCGVLVLKRLSRALSDGDSVLAVVRGSAVNQDGKSQGLTAPNGPSQQAVIRRALARAGLAPSEIDYVECHGTGTPLGDPIEVQALAAVMGEGRAREGAGPLRIGSVKSNFGHTEAAAGVAGIVKTVLALQHEELPPSLHFSRPSPHIAWAELPVRVVTERTPWPRGARPRRAGVSSFGISGTNAHVVLEEAPRVEPAARATEPDAYVLALSARTPPALLELARRYAAHLRAHEGESLADFCRTANGGRAEFEHRAAVVAADRDGLARELDAIAREPEGSASRRAAAVAPRVAFVLSNAGARPGMGRELYDAEPVFRAAIERCAAVIDPLLGASLRAVVEGSTQGAPHAACLAAVQWALVELWRSLGVAPHAVSASGVGARVAAAIEGRASIEDALQSLANGAHVPEGEARLDEALAAFARDGVGAVLELGVESPAPSPVSAASARPDRTIVYLPGPSRDGSARRALLESAAALWALGAPVNLAALDAGRRGRPVPIPTYPFQRQRCWIESPQAHSTTGAAGHPLLGARVDAPSGETLFAGALSLASAAFVSEHRVFGSVAVPAAAMLETAMLAAEALFGEGAHAVTDVAFERALVLPEAGARELRVTAAPVEHGTSDFEIHTRAGAAAWVRHATGRLVRDGALPQTRVDLSAARERCGRGLSGAEFYAESARRGVRLGPAFRVFESVRHSADEALGLARAERDGADEGAPGAHPTLVDSGLQAVCGAAAQRAPEGTWLPAHVERYERPPHGELFVHARLREGEAPSKPTGDVAYCDRDGRVLGRLVGLRVARVTASAFLAGSGASAPPLYVPRWEPSLAAKSPHSEAPWLLANAGANAGIERALEASGVRVEPFSRAALAHARGVIFAPELGETPSPDRADGAIEALLEQVQTLPSGSPLRLLVVLRGAQAVRPGDRVLPQATSVWAFARVLRAERRELSVRLVDLALEAEPDEVARAIRDEGSLEDDEPEVAWRDGARACLRLVLDDTPGAGAPPRAPELKRDGTYLVTGGLGALGLHAAAWLSEHGAGHVVLVSRRGPDAAARATIERLAARVTVARADVADRAALRAVLDAIPADAPLRGVVHAAGAVDDGLIADQTPARARTVLSPKTHGAWNLHELTRESALDFFVLVSSIAALFGNAGQSTYAAGNAFMDGLSLERRRLGLPAVSVAFGPWEGAGLAARLDGAQRARQARMGVRGLSPSAGLGLLEAALGSGHAHVAALRFDPAGWRENFVPALLRRLVAARNTSTGAGVSRLARELASAPMSEREREASVRALVRREASRVLGRQDLADDRPLTEYGLDSLVAVELIDVFAVATGVRLAPAALFDGPTIERIAAVLTRRISAETAQATPARDAATADRGRAAPDEEPDASDEPVTRRLVRDAEAPELALPTERAPDWRRAGGTALFTGATGFVGAYLLAELLRTTQTRFECVARASDAADARRRVEANLRAWGQWDDAFAPRLSYLAGDLEQPRFGASESSWSRLCAHTDAVFHCAAWVNWVSPYAQLRAPNVGGTREALRLATTARLKPLHYVSTLGIFEAPEWQGRVISDADWPASPEGLYLGYTQSKWAAESLVRGAREQGAPVAIYRPGLVSGDSASGAWNADDIICRIVRSCAALGAMADLDVALDLVPVDFVGRSIAALAVQEASIGRTFSLSSDSPLSWRDLREGIAAAGHPTALVPYEDWVRALRRAPRSNPLRALLPLFERRFTERRLSIVELQGLRPRFLADETRPLLPASLRTPPSGRALLPLYLSALRASGSLPPAHDAPATSARPSPTNHPHTQPLRRDEP